MHIYVFIGILERNVVPRNRFDNNRIVLMRNRYVRIRKKIVEEKRNGERARSKRPERKKN